MDKRSIAAMDHDCEAAVFRFVLMFDMKYDDLITAVSERNSPVKLGYNTCELMPCELCPVS